ncbi:uncharacterized protein LOC132612878 [Lycium barbarum]|uniref:uncharacterized protein LOC132612878 n=1 Tax=Lycium barbarum TaxID=112863 RepID=UPI00293F452D|nr:uncharacterized protein LOC132612878 [Lycium barbarum]
MKYIQEWKRRSSNQINMEAINPMHRRERDFLDKLLTIFCWTTGSTFTRNVVQALCKMSNSKSDVAQNKNYDKVSLVSGVESSTFLNDAAEPPNHIFEPPNTTVESPNPTVEPSNPPDEPIEPSNPLNPTFELSTADEPSYTNVEPSTTAESPYPTDEPLCSASQPSNPTCESEVDEDTSGDDLEDGSNGDNEDSIDSEEVLENSDVHEEYRDLRANKRLQLKLHKQLSITGRTNRGRANERRMKQEAEICGRKNMRRMEQEAESSGRENMRRIEQETKSSGRENMRSMEQETENSGRGGGKGIGNGSEMSRRSGMQQQNQ